MKNRFNVNIYTPEKTIFLGEAESLVVPGMSGYFEILAEHAPLVSLTSPGKVRLKEVSGKDISIHSSSGGFLEVSKNKAVLLLNSAEYEKS